MVLRLRGGGAAGRHSHGDLDPRRWPEVVLLLLVFVGHAVSPHVMIADSLRSVYVAVSLVQHGDPFLDEYVPLWGGEAFGLDSSGQHTMPFFPWAPSLFAVPWVALLQLLAAVRGEELGTRFATESDTWFVQVVSMSAVTALTAVVLYRIVWTELGRLAEHTRRRVSLLVVLVFAFGTSAWSTASRSLWGHGPSMLMLAVTLLCAQRARRDPRWLLGVGAALATAYTMRPTNALPALVLAGWAVVVFRRRALALVTGALPVAAVFVAVNVWGYGQVLPFYYGASRLGQSEAGRDVHFLEALAGHMVSPSRGMLVFTPVLVLAVVGFALRCRRREVTSLDLAVGMCAGGHWVAVSLFAHWWGGHSYGPRLLTDITVLLVYLALPAVETLAGRQVARVPRHRTVLVAGVLVLVSWGVVAHGQGALLRSSWCWNVGPVDIEEDPSRVWDWSDPQVVAGLRAVIDGSSSLAQETAPAALIRSGCPEERIDA